MTGLSHSIELKIINNKAVSSKILMKQDFFVKYHAPCFNKIKKKSRGVCETQQYAPSGNKVEKAIFRFKVKVKVTRSLTLVSFERALLVEYACQI